MKFCYILRLTQGKWYVGTTSNVERRLEQHKSGNGGARWTSLYKPVEIAKVVKAKDGFVEDVYVKRYMNEYGIGNVRGGSYCTEVLDPNAVSFIQREINHAKGNCLSCGKEGHFITNCPTRIQRMDRVKKIKWTREGRLRKMRRVNYRVC
jgi:hypothetical protein